MPAARTSKREKENMQSESGRRTSLLSPQPLQISLHAVPDQSRARLFLYLPLSPFLLNQVSGFSLHAITTTATNFLPFLNVVELDHLRSQFPKRVKFSELHLKEEGGTMRERTELYGHQRPGMVLMVSAGVRHPMLQGYDGYYSNNHKDVLIVVDSQDYPELIESPEGDQDDQQFRRKLAWEAFTIVLPMILQFQSGCGNKLSLAYPSYCTVLVQEIVMEILSKTYDEMSYNNYDAAWNCVSEFQNPTCLIEKHTNPSGVASRHDISLKLIGWLSKQIQLENHSKDFYLMLSGFLLFMCLSALAKEIMEFRSPTDGETRMFYEIVGKKKGLEILRGKSKTLRILEAKRNEKGKLSLRQVGGGWLAQDSDDLTPQDIQFKVMSDKGPIGSELHDAEFAWHCVKHVKSNATVIAKVCTLMNLRLENSLAIDRQHIPKNSHPYHCVGRIIVCQHGVSLFFTNVLMSLESLRTALRRAGDKDAIDRCNNHGVSLFFTNVLMSLESLRTALRKAGDKDAIDCCNNHGVSLFFTNVLMSLESLRTALRKAGDKDGIDCCNNHGVSLFFTNVLMSYFQHLLCFLVNATFQAQN
ncbi:hypothetical protein POTOM_031710 [Populus tomentosa]|uniref:Uncharacterized protein n=1 Tax=Populus tomentosa TaxID=118781 RepID=A0A8X7Z6W8_POPTO|nr:hypothetical protein POTOM_031710 [Populus tomentosa]